jgi:methionine-gamma-lyase
MDERTRFDVATELIHADRNGSSDVVPPIYQTSTFSFEDPESMAAGAVTPSFETFYTRHGNPNHAQVERVLARIEGAQAALVTASGMGAICAAVFALTGASKHVVAQLLLYSGTRRLLTEILPRFGVEVTFVDQTEVDAFEKAMRSETALVICETPSNPLLGITDIASVAEIAHGNGSLLAVDNTVATPVNQNPLALGADVVLHSATKYLGGHSDVIAGAAVASRELIDRIWRTHVVLGGVLGPFDAWLLLRGLRTLEMRVHRHNENALAIAEFLSFHPRVRRVYYPGLPSHPQHALAARQMRGFGGLLSFEVEGSFADAQRVVDRLRLAHSAVSLGGVESLVAQPAAMWPGSDSLASLVRLSAGVESSRDLIDDLAHALKT